MSNDDRIHELRRRFVTLHDEGIFVMPNPWDVGSARILASMGFPALATTSSGHAASLGRHDQRVTRDELLEHVAAVSAAVDVPLNVDAERCFADDAVGVSETVALLAGAGAAGCSIEDYDPASKSIDLIDVATARVAAAATAAHEYGIVLTARAENHLYGKGDLDDTITRLCSYRDAGADVVYAPLLVDAADITRVVNEVGKPVNVLALPGVPSVAELGPLGVRRVSTGGALAWVAYGALYRAGRELLDEGTSTYLSGSLSGSARAAAFES